MTAGNVLLTGASSGIGRALAHELARRGARLVVAARREEELAALTKEIGDAASYLVCDVADADDAYLLVSRAARVLGSLDTVIVNAGVGTSKHAGALKLEDVTRVIDVNVRGAMATLVAAIPMMLERKGGHLVGVTSLAGRRALPGGGAYCASKAALSSFLETLRIDLEPAGIRVTDVQPGFVETAMTAHGSHPMPFMWTAERAATFIADGLERGSGILAFPPPLRVLTRIAQLLPYRLHAFATRSMR